MTTAWPFYIPKKPTQFIIIEMNASFTGFFTTWHSIKGLIDGGRDTTGATS
ncbi:MAG: hypothetical protein HRU20_26105 [Pseudomonadales bacterium]|nr:hypothetical protein [Pseudomonadales bacterium]